MTATVSSRSQYHGYGILFVQSVHHAEANPPSKHTNFSTSSTRITIQLDAHLATFPRSPRESFASARIKRVVNVPMQNEISCSTAARIGRRAVTNSAAAQ